MNKSNITTLSDLVTWMVETHPQEDIYLGEVEDDDFDYNFPKFRFTKFWHDFEQDLIKEIDTYYKSINQNWWGKLASPSK